MKMRFFVFAIFTAGFLLAQPPAPPKAKGLGPRGSMNDYQAHSQIGSVSIGAEFTGHSVPTTSSVLNTDDYVVVEMGLYSASGARLPVSIENFSLRVNGKKAIPAESYEAAFKSLDDPAWTPPVPVEERGKGSINGGGSGDSNKDLMADPPPKPHMSMMEHRGIEQQVRESALPTGEIALPTGGLVFFRYTGNDKKIDSVDLLYSGPAGKGTIKLQ